MPPSYGQSLEIAPGDLIGVFGCASPEEATRKSVAAAIKCGARPPRWYEAWRAPWPREARAEYRRQKEER